MMATQDNGPGLLSKVAKFVRNPTVDWVDLDKPAESRAVDSSKLALKQMIERKQYNDAVRRREFDKLRKLRLNPGLPVAGGTAPTSAFQDSWGYSVFEERANTLKKIDEIEAQMSKQWWKGRATDAVPSGQTAHAAQNVRDMDSAFATTMPSDMVDEEESVATQMGMGTEADESAQPAHAVNTSETFAGVFSVSPPVLAVAEPSATDATLEEAAIRFANGDDAGAESALLTALQGQAAPDERARSWAFALLDIYRATGQQVNFERMAADYAKRFNMAAPAWVAMGQTAAPAASPLANSALTPDTAGPALWRSPENLDVEATLSLQALGNAPPTPCWLDWRALNTITPAAGQALAVVLARWCELPLKLGMQGVELLAQRLRDYTPMGDTGVPQFWWQLRLDLLRLLRQPDEFEGVALDFCVTYEISPPSWLPARCQLLPASAAPAVAQLPAATVTAALAQAQPLTLQGEILGDATPVLESLRLAAPAGQPLVIVCANLVRVDFSAAGSMLNWMANAQAAGVRVELRDVASLVAAFFYLIGIHEHARITQRTY